MHTSLNIELNFKQQITEYLNNSTGIGEATEKVYIYG